MNYFEFNLKELVISHGCNVLTIEGIKFEIDSVNRSIAILAESGMGKTTIFKSLLSNYLKIWSSSRPFNFSCCHKFNGVEHTEIDLIKNKLQFSIGFATQSPYFFESHSVRDNIFAPLKWKGKSLEEARKEEYVEKFGLAELSDRKMFILSGGQRQLVNLARMLVLSPQLAIIDECFSSMNEEMAHEKINHIKDTFEETIFLITSHRKTDIATFDGKIIELEKRVHRSGKTYVTQGGADAHSIGFKIYRVFWVPFYPAYIKQVRRQP